MAIIADISSDLLTKAQESCVQVQSGLESYQACLGLWYARQRGYLPAWIQNHIEIWKQLETSVLTAMDNDQQVSQETLELLAKCQDLTNSFLDRIDISLFQKAISPSNLTVDPSALVQTTSIHESLPPESRELYINYGLLISVYNKTADPELRAKIGFMIINYLSKATPIMVEHLRSQEYQELLKNQTQLGITYKAFLYNREDGDFQTMLPCLSKISSKCPKRFLISDLDIQSSLALFFSVTPYKDEKTLEDDLYNFLNNHFENQVLKHGTIDFDNQMQHPILIDLTSYLSSSIITDNNSEKEVLLAQKLEEINEKIELVTRKIIEKIKINHPELFKDPLYEEKLLLLIKLQIGAICRINVDGINTLVQIPLFPNLSSSSISNQFIHLQSDPIAMSLIQKLPPDPRISESLTDFMTLSGLRIGNLEGRIRIAEHVPLESPFTYSVKGKTPQHFPNRLDLINRNFFTKFENRMSIEEFKIKQPHTFILGHSTLKLIKGFLGNITEEKWVQLNSNPETRIILQTLLYRMTINLYNAENHIDDFTKFAHDIELAHCDLLNLLCLVMPFPQGSFNEIYRSQLTAVPEEFRKTAVTGLHKSGMNNFYWVLTKLQEQQPHKKLNITYGLDSYYQSVTLIGKQNTVERVTHDPSITNVDLYLGEFNHNISTDPAIKIYEPGKITEDIEQLLREKPATTHLTVAIDCTIDDIFSERVQELLTHFQKEIKDGKLNFVFFRSGQKFDMIGLDNYYGAPMFVINNGASYWSSFANLDQDEAYQTDPISQQWFSLVYKYAPDMLDAYREQLFANTRRVLDNVPPALKDLTNTNPPVKITYVSPLMKPCFIDLKIKTLGKISSPLCEDIISRKLREKGCEYHVGRGSFGFIHTNFGSIPTDFGSEYETYRINPGLDPKESEAIIEALQEIADLSAD